jgi:hypothetical protein
MAPWRRRRIAESFDIGDAAFYVCASERAACAAPADPRQFTDCWRTLMRGWKLLVLSCLLLAPAMACAADLSFTVNNPKFPTPLVTSILGLCFTAIVVVGARACLRSPNTMMYMVLASLSLTAVLVAYSDRLYGDFHRAGLEKLAQLEREQAQKQAK